MNQIVINSIVSKAHGLHANQQMLPGELQLIYDKFVEYYKGGNSLEIGAFKGMTSYVILNAIDESGFYIEGNKHYIVDVFAQDKEDWDWGYGPHPKKELLNNIGTLRKYANVIKSRSLDYKVIGDIIDKRFDFAFIDGDHRTATLLLELHLVDYLCDHILVHDYGHPQVTRAVDMFLNKCGYDIKCLIDNTGLYEIIKEVK